MADGELWLTRDVAVERLRRFLKLSVGAAEAAFDQAMSSGTIRSRTFTALISEPNFERLVFEDRLEPEAWKRGDRRSLNGEVSSDDLEFWVAAAIEALMGTAEKPCSTKKLPIKHRVVLEAVKACFPEGLPDEVNLPNPKLCDRLQKWLSVHRPEIKMVDKTILRAVGRI